MNRKTIAILLSILIASSVFTVSGSPTTKTVSASTGDIELFADVKVKFTYSLQAQLYSLATTTKLGERTTWNAEIGSATIKLSVFVPQPINRWYSTTKSLSEFASSLNIPISSGLSATLRASPSVTLSINGPASLSTTSLYFSNEQTTKQFYVTAHSATSSGSTIKVNADFKMDMSISLDIDLFLFSQQIANTNIGQFPLTPTISETITVSTVHNILLNIISHPLFIFSVIIVVPSVAIMAIVARRKGKKQEIEKLISKPAKNIKKTTTVEKIATKQVKTVYCIYCGESLPSQAVYCRKCGKKT